VAVRWPKTTVSLWSRAHLIAISEPTGLIKDSGPRMARVYADVNQRMPRSYWDYRSAKMPWGVLEHYEVVRKIGASGVSHQIRSNSGSYRLVLTKRFSALVIGRGKHAEVFEGVHVTSRQICAIKALKPVAMKKVKREIKILQNLSGGPNIVTLLDVVRDSQVSSALPCAPSSS
jgi:casein kinase II subunit alpha